MNVNLLLLKSKLTWKAGCLTLIVILNASAFSYGVTGPGAAWQYVRKISLAPATATSNLQVKVTLAAGQYGNMNASGNDLRFYDSNNNPCSYWIETWNTGGASVIWVKVPVAGTASLYLYYGNAAAGAASNGDETFLFFDDFSGSTLNTNKWESTVLGAGSSITQNGNGNITLRSGGNTDLSGAQIIGITSFNVNDGVIVETRLGAIAPQNTGLRGSLCGASDRVPGSGICYFDAGTLSNWAITTAGRSAQWGIGLSNAMEPLLMMWHVFKRQFQIMQHLLQVVIY